MMRHYADLMADAFDRAELADLKAAATGYDVPGGFVVQLPKGHPLAARLDAVLRFQPAFRMGVGEGVRCALSEGSAETCVWRISVVGFWAYLRRRFHA